MTQPIYYMRDNHTFKKLSDDVSTAMVEIEHEFNDGYTYGMLCSKRDGFPTVHAAGSKNRLTFFADCQAVLEQWLPAAPPQRKPLTDAQILNVARGHYNPHQRPEISFARAIEAAHGIKE